MSTAKLGITCSPEAVWFSDCPVAKRFKYFANSISIDVELAPVSKWAITTIERSGIFKGGFLNILAVEISTGRLNPDWSNGSREKSTATCVSFGGGGLTLTLNLHPVSTAMSYAKAKAGERKLTVSLSGKTCWIIYSPLP